MQKPEKILIAAQHYPPDPSTTAVYIAAIANELATDNQVVVLSGWPDSASEAGADLAKPKVIQVANWIPRKDALTQRAIAIGIFALRMFFATLKRATRRDVVFCVTTPFTLPYAVMLGAKLRGAATILLIYDLYPEALEAASLATHRSLTARLIRLANTVLFRSLDEIITIGRDVAPLLLAYKGVRKRQIHFIPNWALLPIGYREPAACSNRFRGGKDSKFIVGLLWEFGLHP